MIQRMTCRGRLFMGSGQKVYCRRKNPKISRLGPRWLKATDNRIIRVKFLPPTIAKLRIHTHVGKMCSEIASYVTQIADMYGDKPEHIGYTVSDLIHVNPRTLVKTTRINQTARRESDYQLKENQYLTVYLIYHAGKWASHSM